VHLKMSVLGKKRYDIKNKIGEKVLAKKALA
jgi:hypothetical protein